MDATYRSDLRELNVLNFARFEAKLVGELNRLEARMSAFEARIIRCVFVFWVGTLGTLIALRTL